MTCHLVLHDEHGVCHYAYYAGCGLWASCCKTTDVTREKDEVFTNEKHPATCFECILRGP